MCLMSLKSKYNLLLYVIFKKLCYDYTFTNSILFQNIPPNFVIKIYLFFQLL